MKYKRFSRTYYGLREDDVVDLDEAYEYLVDLENKIDNGEYILTTPEELKSFIDMIKMRFYYNFDEIIPSIMSDEIDKILKENYKIEY